MSHTQLPLHLLTKREKEARENPIDEHLSLALIEALTRVWTRIREYHPRVPGVVLLPAPARHGRLEVLGHFAARRWSGHRSEGAAPHHEVVVVAEHLNRPAEEIVETLLHEAAHAANCQAGIKDCSASQYHNRHFKAAAEELGLTVKQVPHYGFAHTELPETTAYHYREEIEALRAVLIHRHSADASSPGPPTPPGPGDDDGDKPRSRNRKATCACPFIIRVSQATISKTIIVCETCGQPFRLV